MSNTVGLIDELLQNVGNATVPSVIANECSIFRLPEDLIRFICVHCEYQHIVHGIHVSCKTFYQITTEFLNSNYYIYRLHIVSAQLHDPLEQKPLTIAQIKYFNEYKYLLSSYESNTSDMNKKLYNPAERCKISLGGIFGKCLSAQPSGTITCDRVQRREWETFTSIPLSHNKIALRSHHNKYVSVSAQRYFGVEPTLECKSDTISQYETFTVYPQNKRLFAFKSCDNKYVSAQPNGSIEINRDKALKWEGFDVNVVDELCYNHDNNLSAFDQRIPITHILLRYNKYYDKNNNYFRKWLYRNWNNGNIFSVTCESVNKFKQFMDSMNINPSNMLSLNNTVKLLRLTNRSSPQPSNDQNRLCNALSIIQKYGMNNNKKNSGANVYGLDIGFHIGDNTKQKYLVQNFIPNLNVLHDLRFIILHGCHKENRLKTGGVDIDLFYDTLKSLNNIIYIDLSCFCSKLKATTIASRDSDEKDESKGNKVYNVLFPTSVQCIKFGFAFEISAAHKIKVENICELTQLKMLYIGLNPKLNKMPIEFIGQFILDCPALDTVAVNLAGLVWQNLRYDTTAYLENISKYWKVDTKQKRNNKLNVVVITTQNGVHSAFKKIINACFAGNDMINIQYLDCTAGIKWLFEYVSNNIGIHDFMFRKLWRVYHFSRVNFSPLHVNFHSAT